jgi:hypothetical protein
MKKIVSFTVIFSMAAFFVFTACGGGKIGGTVEGESFVSEGWIDDNTYRLTGVGVPMRGYTGKTQRRQTARRAAILSAQYSVLEKFTGGRLEGAAGMKDFESTGTAVAQEVAGVIKGGSVVKETYNEEDDCEVIYEVKAKGLKKKVQSSDIK